MKHRPAESVADIETALREQARVLRAIMGQAVKAGKLHHAIAARTDLGRVQTELHRREEATRAANAETEVERIQILRGLAEGDGSWVAAAKYAAMESVAQAAGDHGALDPVAMTPEDWRAAVLEDAQSATDQDLELYAHEWMVRNGMRLVIEGDETRIVRAAP